MSKSKTSEVATIENLHIEMNGKYENAIQVETRVVYLSLHDIDTTNEKYSGEIYIESRWPIEQELAYLPQSITKEWRPKWTPEIQIVNIISETKCELWYRIGQDTIKNCVFVYELRKIKGVFYEKLELQSYPFDTQQLQLKLVSNRHANECVLVKNSYKMSFISYDNFRDSQEWKLYQFVDVLEGDTVKPTYTYDNNEHSTISFICMATRKSGYFYLNAFFLIFLITVIGFNTFSIPYNTIGARLQPTVTLMLTSVSFKWVINRSLPPIAYLTTLDIYSIFGILFLSLIACWHGICGFYYVLFGDKSTQQWIDTGVLIAFACVFILLHVFFVLSHYFRHYQPKFEYLKKEKDYLQDLHVNDNICASNPIQYSF